MGSTGERKITEDEIPVVRGSMYTRATERSLCLRGEKMEEELLHSSEKVWLLS